jgi:hypothetical protein
LICINPAKRRAYSQPRQREIVREAGSAARSGARFSSAVSEFGDAVAQILDAHGITSTDGDREGELQFFHLMVALVIAALLAGRCGADGGHAAERRTGRVRGASHGSLSFHFAILGAFFQPIGAVFW